MKGDILLVKACMLSNLLPQPNFYSFHIILKKKNGKQVLFVATCSFWYMYLLLHDISWNYSLAAYHMIFDKTACPGHII